LLAAVTDSAVLNVLDHAGFERVTPHTIADRKALLADLASTRQRGYSLDQQEAVSGVFCVGAPVRDHTGRSIAAVSLSTIKDFFNPARTGPLVARAAVEISHAMGWKGDAAALFQPVPGSELLLIVGSETKSGRRR
jgi:IclR family acetate operon transcriptional repressor